MKSQVNASPQRSCLATRSCAVFSPTSSHAGLRERAHHARAARTWWPPAARPPPGRGRRARRRPRSRSRTAARPLAHPRRRRAALGGEPREPGLAAGDAAVAAVGEEQLRVAADADPARRRARRRRRAASSASIAARQVERRPVGLVAALAKRVEHLVPDLVAARPDARPDAPRATRSAAQLARPAPPRASTIPAATPRQPQCTAATAPGAASDQRDAVRDQHERRHVRATSSPAHRPRGQLPASRAAIRSRTWISRRAVHLAPHRDRAAFAPERLRQQPAVAPHAVRVVLGEDRRG